MCTIRFCWQNEDRQPAWLFRLSASHVMTQPRYEDKAEPMQVLNPHIIPHLLRYEMTETSADRHLVLVARDIHEASDWSPGAEVGGLLAISKILPKTSHSTSPGPFTPVTSFLPFGSPSCKSNLTQAAVQFLERRCEPQLCYQEKQSDWQSCRESEWTIGRTKKEKPEEI